MSPVRLSCIGLQAFTIIVICWTLCFHANAQQDIRFETPQEAFDAYTTAYRSKEWHRFARSNSLSQKKFMLLTAIQGAQMYHQAQQGAVYAKHNLNIDEIMMCSRDTDAFINRLINQAENLDVLLAELLELCDDYEEDYDEKLFDLQVDGDRARGTRQSKFTSGNKSVDTVWFRKYNDSWTVCVEGEWKNGSYLQRLVTDHSSESGIESE